MKVAIVCADAMPSGPPEGRYGGLERITHSLSRHLAELGLEVSLYALSGSLVPEGVEHVEIQRVSDLLTPEGTDDLLKHDVVHDHSWSLIAWQLAQQHPEREFVMTWHGPHLGGRVNWRPPPANLAVCGVSDFHSILLAAELGGGRFFGVHNGIEFDEHPLYEGPREPYLAYLNRLGPEKGLHFAMLLAKRSGLELRVAGTERYVGDEAYTLSMLRRMGRWGIRYEGDLSPGEKWQFLSHATAQLWTPIAFEEPFGMGIVECLATGTPVIALDRGDTRELVHDLCILRPLDLGADGLTRVLERIRWAEPRRWRQMAELYSARTMALNYLSVYESALAREVDRRGSLDAGDLDAGHNGAGALQDAEQLLESFPRFDALGRGRAGELVQVVEGADDGVEAGEVGLQ